MIRILFICHGNICRSPMGEYILKDMVAKRGIADQFRIASAATSMEEIGNPVYPPARRKLKEYGISSDDHHARRLELRDYWDYDYLLGMEQYNIRNMMRMLGSDPEGKVCRLMDFTEYPRDIADPWYTDDFETTYKEVKEGCEAFLATLEREGRIIDGGDK